MAFNYLFVITVDRGYFLPRARYSWNEEKYATYLKAGRGRGTGKSYKPWLTVSDVPSLGRSHRSFCDRTGRCHHFLSDNEYYAFTLMWWNDNVIDIREQFPLDREETFKIALINKIRHPVDPRSRSLWVMTTDLVVTEVINGKNITKAYSVKEWKELYGKQKKEKQQKRVIEKLEIEKQYWEARNVSWQILTEQQLKNEYTQNLSWLLGATEPPSPLGQNPFFHNTFFNNLLIIQEQKPDFPLRIACRRIDESQSLKPGTTLAMARYFLSKKILLCDLTKKYIQDLPMKEFSFNVNNANLSSHKYALEG